jgi:hypothetical protein
VSSCNSHAQLPIHLITVAEREVCLWTGIIIIIIQFFIIILLHNTNNSHNNNNNNNNHHHHSWWSSVIAPKSALILNQGLDRYQCFCVLCVPVTGVYGALIKGS